MDMMLLSKKISSYRTATGRITRLPDELAYEILLAWEEWSGPASGFYKALGADYRKMAKVMGRAKKLKREGAFDDSQFKEVRLSGDEVADSSPASSSSGVVLRWDKKRVIRFSGVDQLIEFLNKMGGEKHEAAGSR